MSRGPLTKRVAYNIRTYRYIDRFESCFWSAGKIYTSFLMCQLAYGHTTGMPSLLNRVFGFILIISRYDAHTYVVKHSEIPSNKARSHHKSISSWLTVFYIFGH